MVVCRDWAVAKNISHVCLAENVEFSLHHKIVEQAADGSVNINVCLAVSHALVVLFLANDLVVSCTHLHINLNFLKIAEINISHDVERVVVMGIDSKVLKQQLASHDADRVVVETKAHAVWDTYEIGGVEI